jgi:hypothetical protein
MRYFTVLFLFQFVLFFNLYGQGNMPLLERSVSIKSNNEYVKNILNDLSQQSGAVFSYNTTAINSNARISINVHQKSLRYTLNHLFGETVKYKAKGKYIILTKNKNAETASAEKHSKHYVEGYLYESRTGEKLKHATIYNESLTSSATTDNYGYFRIELNADKKEKLRISKSGYTDTVLMNVGARDSFVNINLASKTAEVRLNDSLDLEHDLREKHIPRWLIGEKLAYNAHNLSHKFFSSCQFSILPYVGTNQFLSGSYANNFSFNLLAGYTQEVRYLEMGGGVNIVRHNLRGFQVAGISNIVGDTVKGIQSAGKFNICHTLHGFQYTGIFNTVLKGGYGGQFSGICNTMSGPFTGIQASGIFNKANTINGTQLSGCLNMTRNNFSGTAISGIGNLIENASSGVLCTGIFNSTGNQDGVQISGIVNAADSVKGIQITGVANTAGVVHGSQIAGLLNLSDELSKGVQVSSLYNYTHNLKGMQIGFINVADSSSGVSIGLLNIIKHGGYNKIEISVNEMKFLNLSFRMGTQYFHTVFSGGIRNDTSAYMWNYGIGMGTSFKLNSKTLFDIDLTQQRIAHGGYIPYKDALYKLEFGIDRRIAPKISLAAAVSFNVYMLDTTTPYYKDSFSKLAPYTYFNTTNNHNTNISGWTGGKLALRFL